MRLHQSSYLYPGEVEGGLLSRNGAGQEVGCCDLSEVCQPHCLSQKEQTVGERGTAKLRLRNHVF